MLFAALSGVAGLLIGSSVWLVRSWPLVKLIAVLSVLAWPLLLLVGLAGYGWVLNGAVARNFVVGLLLGLTVMSLTRVMRGALAGAEERRRRS